jgi:hypothetical protein
MEVCRIVKGQRYSRKLNECQVTRMLRLARETPEERENSILEVNFAYLSPEFFFWNMLVAYLCIKRNTSYLQVSKKKLFTSQIQD